MLITTLSHSRSLSSQTHRQTDRQTESLTSRRISLQTKIYVFLNYEVRDGYYGGADIV